MTEQEVIKTLKCCSTGMCKNCAINNGTANCITSLEEAVSELIKRQRSEIEKLTTEVENLKKQMEWLTGYNQNLMSANTALSEEVFIAKNEAYKEFAEKAAIALANAYTPEYAHWIDDVLDNLLKELVGENK